jgi:glycosyltransferase involved in cell wall biosynthesis
VFIVAEGTTRQLRVLHIVSSGGIAEAMQPSLFMPLLTRLPKQRVKAQVVSLSPGCVRAAMLRQHGVPVHDVALSRQRFSVGGFKELIVAVHAFRPDVIQAWGHTAQIAAASVRKRCDWNPQVICSIAETVPLPKGAGMIDRHKLKLAAKAAARADRVVYTSEAAAAHHRRAGFPDGGHECIGPGVDAARFKPDLAARRKLREQLHVPHEAFVIGMVAPFQPEYDHATLLKAIGELIKANPNLYVLLAGHGAQRGNAPLIAMLGSGPLSTRTQLLGEWSDLTSLFNGCDLVCSSALSDVSRMTLAMAMLCGVPCVATGMGAQGELIGQHGVAIEPGSPSAFIRGITKVLQMTPEKRAQLAQGARKHALQNYVYVRSLQKYLQLYGELVGREAFSETNAAPAVDVSEPIAPPPKPAPVPRKDHAAVVAELADPDSLETKAAPAQPESLPKWRIEQERARAEQDARWSATQATTDGDVLQIFEMELAKPSTPSASPMSERARGVVEEFEELLSVEALTLEVADPKEEPQAQRMPESKSEQASKAEPAASTNSAETPPAKSEAVSDPVIRHAPGPIAAALEKMEADLASGRHQTLDAAPESTLEITAEAPVVDALLSGAAIEEKPQSVASQVALNEPAANTADAATVAGPSEPEQRSLFDLELMPERKEAVSG